MGSLGRRGCSTHLNEGARRRPRPVGADPAGWTSPTHSGPAPPRPLPRRPHRPPSPARDRAASRDHRTYLRPEGVGVTRLPQSPQPASPAGEMEKPRTGSPGPEVPDRKSRPRRDARPGLAGSWAAWAFAPWRLLFHLWFFGSPFFVPAHSSDILKQFPSSLFCASLLPSCSQVTQSVCSANRPFCSQMPAGK